MLIAYRAFSQRVTKNRVLRDETKRWQQRKLLINLGHAFCRAYTLFHFLSFEVASSWLKNRGNKINWQKHSVSSQHVAVARLQRATENRCELPTLDTNDHIFFYDVPAHSPRVFKIAKPLTDNYAVTHSSSFWCRCKHILLRAAVVGKIAQTGRAYVIHILLLVTLIRSTQ